MAGSSFTSVTTKISSLQHSPDNTREVSISLMIVSTQLEALEKKRQDIKQTCETLGLALTEVQNTPPKSLNESQTQQILANQFEWEKELLSIRKELSRLDIQITYLNDWNNDLQERLRTGLNQLSTKMNEALSQKLSLIIQFLKTDNPDLKFMLTKALTQPDIQQLYYKALNLNSNSKKSFTDKLKNFFRREA